MLPVADFASLYWIAAGWTMFHFLWLGTVVGLIAAVLRRALRRFSPQARYAAAIGVLATLAIIPIALFVTLVGTTSPASVFTVEVQSDSPLSTRAELHHSSTGELRDWQSWLADPATSKSASSQYADYYSGRRLLDGARLYIASAILRLPWIWLVGSPLTLIFVLTGVTGVERLRRQCDLVGDEELPAGFERLRSALGISPRVVVGISERVSAPMVLGIVRPLILLPPALLAECSPQQLEMVLLHELAHVRRYDNLVNLLQRVVEAALFFHPVVWQVSRWVRLEREHCCDAVVLRHTSSPRLYAETLASLALPGISPRHALASLANHQLVDRIRHIMNLEDRSMKISHQWTVTVGVLALTTSAVVMTWAQQPSATVSSTTQLAQASELALQRSADSSQHVQQSLDAAAELTVAVDPTTGVASENVKAASSADAAGYIQLLIGLQPEKASWSAAQAVGPPDTPNAGDHPTAWASREPENSDECLTLRYEQPVEAVALLVYETFNPGAISQVRLYDAANREIQSNGFNAAPPAGMAKRILVLPLTGLADKVARVELQVNAAAVPGWNEIDAIGLVSIDGTTHWASAAEASSSYADVVAASQQQQLSKYVDLYQAKISAPEAKDPQGLEKLRADQAAQAAMIEKLRRELELMLSRQKSTGSEMKAVVDRLNEQIEKTFEAREKVRKSDEELGHEFGVEHPKRRVLTAQVKRLSNEYEELLRQKRQLRSEMAGTQQAAEPDRVHRLENDVRDLKKLLEELRSELKQRPPAGSQLDRTSGPTGGPAADYPEAERRSTVPAG